MFFIVVRYRQGQYVPSGEYTVNLNPSGTKVVKEFTAYAPVKGGPDPYQASGFEQWGEPIFVTGNKTGPAGPFNGTVNYGSKAAIVQPSTINSSGWTQVHVRGKRFPSGTDTKLEEYNPKNISMIVEVVMHIEYVDNEVGVLQHAGISYNSPGSILALLNRAKRRPLYQTIRSRMQPLKRMIRRAGYIRN